MTKMNRGYVVLVQVETELTRDALISDVRQAFMRHTPEVKVVSVTATSYLELEFQREAEEG